jgi:hypothetical protein
MVVILKAEFLPRGVITRTLVPMPQGSQLAAKPYKTTVFEVKSKDFVCKIGSISPPACAPTATREPA